MIETTSVCYCDILSEHNNDLYEGASSYKNIIVMTPVAGDGDAAEPVIVSSIDMCSTCRAKYKSTLHMYYNAKRQPVYSFTAVESTNVIQEPISGTEEEEENISQEVTYGS